MPKIKNSEKEIDKVLLIHVFRSYICNDDNYYKFILQSDTKQRKIATLNSEQYKACEPLPKINIVGYQYNNLSLSYKENY